MFFEVNGITVDDNLIVFSDVNDTLFTKTKEETIGLFSTNAFKLNDNSNFEFNINYTLLSEEKLSKKFDLELKLVDSKTNETIGILEKVETSKLIKNKESTVGFKIDTKGIGNREVKLGLVLDKDSFDNISIINTYKTGEENLPKESCV